MKTIRYLGEIDGFFGGPATTRSWNTILSVLRILKHSEQAKESQTVHSQARGDVMRQYKGERHNETSIGIFGKA
jgi:hypothetical protein